MRIASDARRFNLSPPWFDIVSAAESLALLADIGVVELETHAVSLANRFRALLEMPASDSAIVAIDTDRGDRLREAGIAAAVRAGKVRLSFWLYNTTEDAEMAASIILE